LTIISVGVRISPQRQYALTIPQNPRSGLDALDLDLGDSCSASAARQVCPWSAAIRRFPHQ
jgi:hypothetical protein